MKTTTVFLQVPTSLRLPIKNGCYHTDMGFVFWDSNEREFTYGTERRFPAWWLEKQEAIVLTPQQYEERMVGFSEWLTNYYDQSSDGKRHFKKGDESSLSISTKQAMAIFASNNHI